MKDLEVHVVSNVFVIFFTIFTQFGDPGALHFVNNIHDEMKFNVMAHTWVTKGDIYHKHSDRET